MSTLSRLAAIAVVAGLATATAAYAQKSNPSNTTGQGGPATQVGTTSASQPDSPGKAPMGGRDFGAHVSFMASVLKHPLEHGGAMFGDCVSDMAQAGGMESGMCEHEDH